MSTIKVNTLTTLDGTGNITLSRPIVGDGSNLTGISPSKAAVEALGIDVPAANLTGTVADARISTLTSSKLSGALPAIDGSNLTGVAPTKATVEALGIDLPAANLTGTVADARFPATLPASSGVNLTALNASNISSGTLPAGRYTDTVYTHPSDAGNKHIPSGGSSGQFLKYTSAGTATWAADNDTVYTHPTSAGNKHVPSGGSTNQVLTYSSSGTAAWTTPAAGGKILQVVQAVVTAGGASTSSSSMVDVSGLAQAITPSSTSSKILITGHISTGGTDASSCFFQICRGSTPVGLGDAYSSNTRCNSGTFYHNQGSFDSTNFEFLDSPSTTSSTTYKIRWTGGGGTKYLNKSYNSGGEASRGRAISVITLYEIGA
jgi:hypothetical protein